MHEIQQLILGWCLELVSKVISKQSVIQLVNKLRLQLIQKPNKLPITFYTIKRTPLMQRSYGVWKWYLLIKVTIPVAISRRFSLECFLIVKLLQTSHWVKQKVDTLFLVNSKVPYDVKSLPIFTVSFDASLNTDLQMCQMDVVVCFWNDYNFEYL